MLEQLADRAQPKRLEPIRHLLGAGSRGASRRDGRGQRMGASIISSLPRPRFDANARVLGGSLGATCSSTEKRAEDGVWISVTGISPPMMLAAAVVTAGYSAVSSHQ